MEWKGIPQDFGMKWNFKNYTEAIHGQHIAIREPTNSGSLYYSHKGTFSVVLMTILNIDYEFIMVDAGINERISDGGSMKHTDFCRLFESNNFGNSTAN
jgi:hypothetical protein